MAPGMRARRQRDIASEIRPSVETASNNAPPLSDSNNVSDNRDPSSTYHELNKTEEPQRKRRALYTPEPKPYDPETYGAWGRKHLGEEWYERRNTLLREGKTSVLVAGTHMIISQTYDPDTYDPDRRMAWTPEPEPYDPETYAAWGRKHFGEDWYGQRKTMLQERDIYLDPDPVYKERQRALRVLEHKIEGRPFEPQSGKSAESWKRLWARLSKDLPSTRSGNNSASPMPLHDSDSDLSGYDTYAPTPESREPTPVPEDPWERLEFDRKRFRWDEEEYQFERIFLKEAIIDGTRRKREDEEGNRRREAELAEIRELQIKAQTCKDPDESWRFFLRSERRKKNFQLRSEGWTQEQVDAENRAAEARGREIAEQLRTMPPLSKPVISMTQEEMEEKHRAWDAMGLSREEQSELVEMFGFPDINFATPDRGFGSTVVSQSRTTNFPHQTRSGRITKNTRKRTPAPSLNRRRALSKLVIREELINSPRTAPQHRRRQRKIYEKGRASRRLAGQLPEFGLLPERGETPPLLNPSLGCSPNTHGTRTSDPRGTRPKQLTRVNGARPRGVTKSKQHGASYQKRPTRGSRR